MKADIPSILAQMTLEEKAALCSGKDFWSLKAIERLGIPAIIVTDGPHGLRKQASDVDHVALNSSVPATCFPTASATASSWDRDLLYAVGQALGEECLQEDVAVILGPGANIKRSPLCGRNFEYFSEDPYLAGEMAASLIAGVQSQGVGTSLKHFAVNNQETRRMTIDAVVDERALREIYLPAFERAVKQAQPWTVMCSYNRLGGIYCSEYERLLTQILREEWGFEGLVVTDWGACNERVAGLKAGQDLEMPGSGGVNDAEIVAAVRRGALDVAVLDRTVERLLRLIFTAAENRKPGYRYDPAAHHALARRAAGESMVLLKNDGGLLPLSPGAKIAVIGAFARQPRYQGSGSSLINPLCLDHAQAEFSKMGIDFSYSPGYDPNIDTADDVLIAEACAAARAAQVAVIFAGLPDSYETEAIDREHLRMPESHNRLIERVAAANPNTVVVLSNGAPVEMPWVGAVKAIVEGFLGGEAGGSAALDVLFGQVNPSGKLSETYPLKLADVPSSAYFPSGPKTVEYRESLYVGYRYFDTAHQAVLFPFGHGLSYTTFAYSDLELSAERIGEQDQLKVRLAVKNTGARAGAEVVQLYVSDMKSTAFRPAKELKGFAKLFLQPGEEKTLEFSLDRRAFAYYHPGIADWHVESGVFAILVGASSVDIRARGGVWVESSRPDVPPPDLRQAAPVYYRLPPAPMEVSDDAFRALCGRDLPSNESLPGEEYTINTPLADLRATFVGRQLYAMVMKTARQSFGEGGSETMNRMAERMMADLPLRNLILFSNGQFTRGMVDGLLLTMNRKPVQGVVRLIGALLKKK